MGLLSWIAAGLAAGALASPLLPGPRRAGRLAEVGLAVGGALGGGLLATLLGYGGLLGFDWRSALTALLGALLALQAPRFLGSRSS